MQVSMLTSDVRDGYAIGQRLRAVELERLTGVEAADILAMAAEINHVIVTSGWNT